MFTIFGLPVAVAVLGYFFILPGVYFVKKQQPFGWKRDFFLKTVFVFAVAVSIFGGVCLAIQIGKKFPTHLVKTREVELVSLRSSCRRTL